jgi:deazaflavin-dependent oxidoreductase (nitroreductase family)
MISRHDSGGRPPEPHGRFRSPPRGLLARFARLPILLYKLRLGWLLDSRFLLLSHRGRKTGKARFAVLEVVARDRANGTYFVAAPWEKKADWFSNVSANPEVQITVASKRMAATAEILSAEESQRILAAYGQRHRLAASALARLFAHSSFDSIARSMQVVAFRRR